MYIFVYKMECGCKFLPCRKDIADIGIKSSEKIQFNKNNFLVWNISLTFLL